MRGKLFQIHTIFKVPVLSKQEQEKRACLMYHLEERSVRIREVDGSIPFRSTKNRQVPKGTCRFLFFTIHFFLFVPNTFRTLEVISNREKCKSFCPCKELKIKPIAFRCRLYFLILYIFNIFGIFPQIIIDINLKICYK